jgi:3-oxoacyl-[acyl-carrier-protein] synthase-1
MRKAYLAGGASHTALGTDPAAALAQRGPGDEPERVSLRYGDEHERMPYRLLADCPGRAPEQRLYGVLDAVVERALDEAGCGAGERRGMGLFLGSSSADVSVSEARFQRELADNDAALALRASNSIANLGEYVHARFGLGGPDFSFNTACTASANALAAAADRVATGRLDAALVVGVELFNVVTAAGFQSLGLIAAGNMRPFDRARDGLTLGEGCAAVVVSARASAPDDLHLRGAANLCDTYSMSTALPDGSTVAAVMRRALARAQLAPAELAAIKVHGTASLQSDEAESAGMAALFETLPPVCALKPWLGHTLGACGLNELLLFRAAARKGVLLATPGIAGAASADLGVHLNQCPRVLEPGHYMLNYFGFGGNNTSLIVSNV